MTHCKAFGSERNLRNREVWELTMLPWTVCLKEDLLLREPRGEAEVPDTPLSWHAIVVIARQEGLQGEERNTE